MVAIFFLNFEGTGWFQVVVKNQTTELGKKYVNNYERYIKCVYVNGGENIVHYKQGERKYGDFLKWFETFASHENFYWILPNGLSIIRADYIQRLDFVFYEAI